MGEVPRQARPYKDDLEDCIALLGTDDIDGVDLTNLTIGALHMIAAENWVANGYPQRGMTDQTMRNLGYTTYYTVEEDLDPLRLLAYRRAIAASSTSPPDLPRRLSTQKVRKLVEAEYSRQSSQLDAFAPQTSKTKKKAKLGSDEHLGLAFNRRSPEEERRIRELQGILEQT